MHLRLISVFVIALCCSCAGCQKEPPPIPKKVEIEPGKRFPIQKDNPPPND